ncbi:MAG: radical SAM protein [Planctomycetes bacterium]|nr:radical SAM protein [Planctomycetota bacterium]
MSSADQFRIDSHKLHLHPGRVAGWLEGGNIQPIYMEIGPVGACNHRCTFCGVDFMGYQSRRLPLEAMQRLLPDLGRLGVRSIMYAGEGEPLLHPDIAAIAELTKASGTDVSFTTNATMLRPELAERLLPVCSWIKTSINAGTAATYARIHRTKEADFARVLANMTAAAELKRRHGWTCTLGMQAVLLPENWDEMDLLARQARDAGMDYLVVKPYSQHTQGLQKDYQGVRYDQAEGLAQRLQEFATDSFKPLVRLSTMRKWDEKQRPYQRCLSLPFWSYIDAGGDVWGCSIYMKDPRFHYGNVLAEGWAAIWEGEKRRASLRFVHEELDIGGCRVNCRMDEVNRYLWELRHPTAHANFI